MRSRRRAAYPHASSSATETISLPRRCCWTETIRCSAAISAASEGICTRQKGRTEGRRQYARSRDRDQRNERGGAVRGRADPADPGAEFSQRAGDHAQARAGAASAVPLMWAACVAALCAMATTSVYAVCEPYSSVTVDGEESVEYTLNRFDWVIGTRVSGEKPPKGESVPPFTHARDAVRQAVKREYANGPGKCQHHGLLARQRQGRGAARDAREARRRARGRWGGAPGAAHPDRAARERKDGRYVTHSEQSATCGVPEGLGRFAYKNHVQFG